MDERRKEVPPPQRGQRRPVEFTRTDMIRFALFAQGNRRGNMTIDELLDQWLAMKKDTNG